MPFFFFFPCLPWPLVLSWPLWGSPSLSSYSPVVPIAPSTAGPAKLIPPAHPESKQSCEQNSGAPNWSFIRSNLQPNRPDPKHTWTGRRRLCQCWGHSLTCLHSPHWGAALQSTHRMLQMQRLQKAVKKETRFLFYFISQADLCSSSCPLGSGYPSHHALRGLPHIIPAPFQKANTKNHKNWSSVASHRQNRHRLSVSGISALPSSPRAHLGFTRQAAI